MKQLAHPGTNGVQERRKFLACEQEAVLNFSFRRFKCNDINPVGNLLGVNGHKFVYRSIALMGDICSPNCTNAILVQLFVSQDFSFFWNLFKHHGFRFVYFVVQEV
jgi:hypothetical protein